MASRTCGFSARSREANNGEQRRTSDVDLLVDLPKDMTLLDLVGLKLDLEERLHRKVDDVIGRTRQQATPAEAALSTIRLQKLLTPPLTLDAEVSPIPIPDSSEEGSGVPVALATVE